MGKGSEAVQYLKGKWWDVWGAGRRGELGVRLVRFDGMILFFSLHLQSDPMLTWRPHSCWDGLGSNDSLGLIIEHISLSFTIRDKAVVLC